MTIGTGAQVKIGTDVAPTYTPWTTLATNRWVNPSFDGAGSAVTVRQNLVTDPRCTSTSGWTTAVSGGAGAVTAVTGGTGPFGMTTYVRSTASAAGTYQDLQHTFTTVSPLAVYSFGLSVRFMIAGASVARFVQWLDGSNAVLSTNTAPTLTAYNIGDWTRFTYEGLTAPSGAVRARYIVRFVMAIPNGNVMDGSAYQIENSAVLLPYFDGTLQPTVRENLVLNARSTSPVVTGWNLAPRWYGGGGGSGATTYNNAETGLPDQQTAFARKTWTTVGTSPAQDISWQFYNGWRPVTAGTTFHLRIWWRTTISEAPASNMLVLRVASDNTGTTVLETLTSPNVVGPAVGQWQLMEYTFTTSFSGYVAAWHQVYYNTLTAAFVGATLDATAPMVEIGTTGGYFDYLTAPAQGFAHALRGTAGASASWMYDTDFSVGWTGTANASVSRLTGVQVAGFTNSQGGIAIQSGRWYKNGTKSARVIRTTPASTNALAYNDLPWTVPASVTTEISVYMGDDTAMAQGIVALYDTALNVNNIPLMTNAQRPAIGTSQTFRATGSTATWASSARLVLRPGDEIGESIWYDSSLLVFGTYTGAYFDGATPNTDTERYVWSGTANASTSTFESRDLISDGSASRWNIANYSVVEDSTPMDPSDSRGGFGQITVSLRDADIKRLMGQPLTITDGALGETIGTVRQMSGNGLEGQLVANSRLGNLAVERTIQPFVGTLTACLNYLLGLCGITSGIVIDSSYNSVNVQVPGGRENVYDRLVKMGASYGFEMSLVSNNVVIRPPRQREAVNYRAADVAWTLDQSQMARSIIGYWYNTYSGTQIAYPIQGDDTAMDVFQVDAGETKVYDVVLDASLSAISQPVASTGTDYRTTTTSRYAVSTMDGVTIDPGVWVSTGGSVTVSISEDTNVATFTIRGANLPDLSPFRIATPDGTGGFISALRVTGNGVFWRKEKFTFVLGENQDIAPDEIGVEVDVPFMETFDQMYHRLLYTAQRYGTDTQTIQVTTGGINRLGETGSARYATIGDVNAKYPGATIASIYPLMGPTIADWNANALAMVSGDFANQAYGNVNGARVLNDHSYYRIRSATIGPRQITYSAERDNAIGDVYTTGETIAQWNARWAGKTIRDVNIAPLIKESSL